ncbi:TOMM precursor leader peptide-binding protein [Polyangium sorediatum]|uniref:TOMM leader peptide-binding protein n=1 Tax=Polyangium sorediatum TaxID=889274 RepID=A0ABT6NY44_9BACT|nr:TOMM precursor leader peptide-binding protein [Polyangium sorediatum]MDI1433259.1 TOMM precursor leader peptide-binding protein [Polyangium sorediatum]
MEPLELSQVLALKPTLRVERVETGAAFLIGERERFVLSGASTVEVAMLVDGRRTVHDILHAARARVSEPEALYILSKLAARGYLVPAAPELPSEATAFWHGVGLDGRAATEALRRTPVSVQTLGEAIPAAWMTEALVQAGVRVDGEARVQVVVSDDSLRPELAAINRRALAEGTPWFLMKPTGVQPLLGPVFEPGAGPCWECLSFWIRQNRPVEEMVRRRGNDEGVVAPPRAAMEASIRTACGIGALVIARVLAGGDRSSPPPLGSRVLALDWSTFQTTAHAVVRRPQCPTCGDRGLMTDVGERPIELQPIEKAHYEDGGYRRQTPRQTYERYQHLISPITGAVTHLIPMPGKDTELRAVYASGYLVCPRDGVPHANVFDKACAGKGRSADQSRVSALCEALERYSGVYQGDEARVRGSKDELGAAALCLGDLLNFSDAQYHARDRLRAQGVDRRQSVPEPLDASTRIDWTPGWSLSKRERRYVPLAYCYAEAPAESGTAFCGPCSNGVAAGTCLEEALLQALLELVERDAAAIWWYNRMSRPAIDLESFADPYFDAIQADSTRLGWKVWALDLTHDLGIPTCAALAHEPRADRFAIGFGCHLDPHLAVQRSLTELNQLFDPEGTRRAPWDVERLLARDYLFPHPDLPRITAGSFPRIGGADLRADIEHCAKRIEEAGLELVVVDKTRPDIGLHVIQVIVPGLRHFWPRFGPGRLYQVPCALGWLARPLAESELNPVPLFV